jgi:hypothetical protein
VPSRKIMEMEITEMSNGEGTGEGIGIIRGSG